MDLAYTRRHLAAGVEVRVQTHPATDAWMSGDRYGTVVKVGRELIHVKMDRSGLVRHFHPSNIELVD